mmetsp:Transcript_15493/g.24531  ORF Transcript_15493/g.24531 Transcript_15493/m.24531 type:complete len:91 (+) Transcript_15493:226-498(+)
MSSHCICKRCTVRAVPVYRPGDTVGGHAGRQPGFQREDVREEEDRDQDQSKPADTGKYDRHIPKTVDAYVPKQDREDNSKTSQHIATVMS